MVNPEQIEKLIWHGELDRVERTISVNDTDKFSHALCAFANDLADHRMSGFYVNDYRNPVISEAVKILGYVNRFSRGVARVNEELYANGNGYAAFDFGKLTVFEVVVPLSVHFAVSVAEQVTEQVDSLIQILEGEMDRQTMQGKLDLSHRENFRSLYLKPALDQGFVEMTIPGSPTSRLQRYRLTAKGRERLRQLKNTLRH